MTCLSEYADACAGVFDTCTAGQHRKDRTVPFSFDGADVGPSAYGPNI